MTGIRIVSWIHGLWGLSILLLPAFGLAMPRPFGSLEAYFALLPVEAMAVLFVVTALASVAALAGIERWPLLAALGVAPQQVILLWGLVWGILGIADDVHRGAELDVRTWLGCCYLLALTWFHGLDVRRVYVIAFQAGGRDRR